MIRRLCMLAPPVVAVAVMLGAVMLGAGLAPAAAAGDQLGLSRDGSVWSSTLSGTLFDRSNSPRLWVPGDAATTRFYVRDQAGERAALLVEYRHGATRLIHAPDLQVSARVGTGAWQRLAGGRDWVPLARGSLAGGAMTTVTVRAVFHWSSGNGSQGRTVPLWFRVTLSQASAPTGQTGPGSTNPTGPGGTNPTSPGGLLPNTGSAMSLWTVALAALSLGAGLALVAGSRSEAAGDE